MFCITCKKMTERKLGKPDVLILTLTKRKCQFLNYSTYSITYKEKKMRLPISTLIDIILQKTYKHQKSL